MDPNKPDICAVGLDLEMGSSFLFYRKVKAGSAVEQALLLLSMNLSELFLKKIM